MSGKTGRPRPGRFARLIHWRPCCIFSAKLKARSSAHFKCETQGCETSSMGVGSKERPNNTERGFTMAETIRDLLVEEMQDLYDAEKQLVKALPKMAKAASNEELSEAFGSHLEQTKGQVERLE